MTQLREYSVCLHNYEDLEEFYNDMETPGGSLYIPDRAVELTKRRPISRQTHYRLTEEEAAQIRQDARVKFVELTPEEAGIEFKLSVTQTSSNWNKSKTINDQQRNWGLLASTSATNPTGWGADTTPTVSGSATWTPTGANVDVVIADGHILSSHPEFDTRFVAYNWYQDTPAVTGGSAGTYSYASTVYNYHATHVAGIAVGNTHGWARSANIYNISIIEVATSELFDYVRYWHANKPINGVTGRRNPTVLNCSFETAYAGGALQSASSISSVTYRGTTYSGPFTQSALEGYGFVFNADGNLILPSQTSTITQDVWDTIDAGVIVVNAAGNTWQKIDVPGGLDYNNTCQVGGDTIYYNRGSSLVGMDVVHRSISVGGVSDKSSEYKLSMSASGPRIDIFAPAESINSSWPDTSNLYNDANWYAYEPLSPVLDSRGGGYIMKLSGTSMASPQVAGVVAALLETNWTWTPAQALDYLTTNAVVGRMTSSGVSGNPLSHKASLAQYNLNGANNRYLYLSASPPPPPVVTAPVANFSASVTSGVAPLTVNFTDSSTNSPTSWAWDIDNSGSTDYTIQNPSHTFSSAGTYSVKLTASNSGGSDVEIKTGYIVVSSPPTNITNDPSPWVFDNSSPPSDTYSLATTSASGYNTGLGRKTFEFDFLSNGYFAENVGGHFAVVLRNNLAAISSGYIQGQGIIIGNVSGAPTPTSPPLPPGVPFAPNPAFPSTQVESFWNGVALDSGGNPYYANTLLANTNGANPILQDGVTYRFSIVSEIQAGGSYTGYAILQGSTVVYDQPLIYDYNTFYDSSQTNVLLGHVFENSGAAPWSVTISNKTVTWSALPPPPTATYTLTPASSNVNEGTSLTFTVGGTNIVNGTYYWTVTNSGDFGTSSGSFTITSNSGTFSVTPTADILTEGAETFTVSIRSGSTSGTILQTSSVVTINDSSTSVLPFSTTGTIQAVHYNDIHNLITEVISVGENGYGISSFLSNPVTNRNISTASLWRRLQFDLNTAYLHITNQFAIPPGTITTGTTITTAALTNQYWTAANFVLNNRYTCHPEQYFVDPNTLANINTTEGTSTRTLVGGWGLDPESSITHKVNVTWASRLTTRYFFNCGGKFEWVPYHTNTSTTGLSLNDLDEEWATFINHFQQAETYVYDRQTYEDWETTSTVYNSGTLRISILADQETDRNIRFTFTFTNIETPDLVVIPSSEYYNIIV